MSHFDPDYMQTSIRALQSILSLAGIAICLLMLAVYRPSARTLRNFVENSPLHAHFLAFKIKRELRKLTKHFNIAAPFLSGSERQLVIDKLHDIQHTASVLQVLHSPISRILAFNTASSCMRTLHDKLSQGSQYHDNLILSRINHNLFAPTAHDTLENPSVAKVPHSS